MKIPVIGCGGIASAEDAVEYLLAGATAVQVGTASFLGSSIKGSGPVNDSGATYAYQDCGVNVTPAPANCANSTT